MLKQREVTEKREGNFYRDELAYFAETAEDFDAWRAQIKKSTGLTVEVTSIVGAWFVLRLERKDGKMVGTCAV